MLFFHKLEGFALLVTTLIGSSFTRSSVILPRALGPTSQVTTTSLDGLNNTAVNPPPLGDHPDWAYLNGIPWYKTDATQQDHARFHALLSMSAYGDYTTLCPQTFTKGFTVLQNFNTGIGQAGYIALIPEMAKVVIVFRGFDDYNSLNWDPVSIEDLVSDCPGCKAATGVKALYVSAKQATNNWAIAKQKVKETNLKFSVTGHGVGGAVAVLAGLDLGATNDVHYSHNQGMPRAINYPAVVRYDNLFQVLAGQSLVSVNDFMVNINYKNNYYHVGSKVKISGELQQWLTNCYGYNENSTCIGDGSDYNIHYRYYTPIGQCGSVEKGW